MNKIIFIGPNCVNKFDYAHALLKYNDSLSLSTTFTTNPEYKDKFVCYKEDEREEFIIKYYKRK